VRMCVPDRPIPHASVAQQRVLCGLTAEALERNLGDGA